MNYEISRIFSDIYKNNSWLSLESKSGTGSEIGVTQNLITIICSIIKQTNVKKVVDLGCGDCNWMSKIITSTGIEYTGYDIVAELITQNTAKYPDLTFATRDITSDAMEQFDMAIARDVFVHLPFLDILRIIEIIKLSNTRYLLANGFSNDTNTDIQAGDWRRINLRRYPFMFEPVKALKEQSDDADKEVLLYDLNNISIDEINLRLWYEGEVTIRSKHLEQLKLEQLKQEIHDTH